MISQSSHRSATIILLLLFVTVCSSIRVCSDRLNAMVSRVCTFANEKTPCFKGAFFNAHGLGGLGNNLRPSSTTDGIATQCCTEGCNYDYIRKFCCYTYKCLRHCYPTSNYTEADGILIV